ncbi:MAG: hypothetical protein RRA94_09250 [Bacteroidota bacterium]|nr:hypothetical protein [Bacteroidota bacterium]
MVRSTARTTPNRPRHELRVPPGRDIADLRLAYRIHVSLTRAFGSVYDGALALRIHPNSILPYALHMPAHQIQLATKPQRDIDYCGTPVPDYILQRIAACGIDLHADQPPERLDTGVPDDYDFTRESEDLTIRGVPYHPWSDDFTGVVLPGGTLFRDVYGSSEQECQQNSPELYKHILRIASPFVLGGIAGKARDGWRFNESTGYRLQVTVPTPPSGRPTKVIHYQRDSAGRLRVSTPQPQQQTAPDNTAELRAAITDLTEQLELLNTIISAAAIAAEQTIGKRDEAFPSRGVGAGQRP